MPGCGTQFSFSRCNANVATVEAVWDGCPAGSARAAATRACGCCRRRDRRAGARRCSADPPLLESGLVAAVSSALGRLAVLNPINIPMDADPDIVRMPAAVELTAFRVIQEAVNNAHRHAHARAVSVTIRKEEQSLYFAIEDNGGGFDVAAALARAGFGQSMGLPAMRERVEVLGGMFFIDSRRGRGTRIEARTPLEA